MKKIIAILSALTVAATMTAVASAASLGDVNGDGRINSADALSVLKYSVGTTDKNFNKSCADVNDDGKINSADALKILQVSVGLGSFDSTPSSTSEIVNYYNDSLKKAYAQAKTGDITTYDSGTYTVNGEKKSYDYGKQTVHGEFEDGKDQNDLNVTSYGPDTKLTAEMLSSAKISKSGSGYRIDLVLKSEKVDVKKAPVYNKAGAFVFEFCATGTSYNDFTSGSVTYTGTTIEAYTDANGRLTKEIIKIPFTSDLSMRQSAFKTDKITEKGSYEYTLVFTY